MVVRKNFIGSFESGWSIMGKTEGMMEKVVINRYCISYQKVGKENMMGK